MSNLASLFVEEDGGLAALLGTASSTLAREAALREGAVLEAARDVLQTAFADEARRSYLDPFAPAAERSAEVARVLRSAIAEHRLRGGPLARVPTDDETLQALFAATLGWGPAQRYLDDERVNEVKIVGRRIRVQEAGKPFVTVPEAFASTDEVQARALLLASVLGVRLDAETPQATLPIAHGTRMHVSIPPRTVDGALICIRRGRREAWALEDLLKRGTLDQAVTDLLLLLSRARCSMLIAGRTGSGKTGLLEALANSWPGEAHTLTIEDHTMEIGIRRADLWTRELVDTQRDAAAFGRVAREALRQTPDLVIPGEIRGSEAGAILALILSDHPVLSTLHARSCREAIERFASCAALPGAYMYEGRRDDALRDACQGVEVLIRVDFWEETGRRLVTEVALLDGSETSGSALTPRILPLVSVDVQEGQVGWRCAARAESGALVWEDGVDHTPAGLREKLRRAQARAQLRTGATTLDAVADALARADRLLQAGAGERALAVLVTAWAERRDARLLAMAQRALAQLPNTLTLITERTHFRAAELEQLITQKRWTAARVTQEALLAHLDVAAALAPADGWEPIRERITAGLAHEAAAEQAQAEAMQALAQGQPGAALAILKGVPLGELAPERALALTRLREQALEALFARGEGSAEALSSVRAQRAAYEQTEGENQ